MRYCILILLFYLPFATAQNNFESGNVLYKSGQYQAALEAYQNILSTHKQSSELYFNMGNCYYKLNQVAPAIYYYEKALVLNPKNAAAENNLQLAHKLQIDDIKDVPKVGFAKLLQNLTGTFHYNTWAWIAVGFSVGVLLFFCLYYFSENTTFKRFFFVTMALCLLSILISLGSGIYEKNVFDNDRPAIIFAASTGLKKTPTANSKNIKLLHEGTKVMVFETQNNFQKVQLTDGTKGWLLKSDIKEVK